MSRPNPWYASVESVKRSQSTTAPRASAGLMTSMTFCLLDAANKNNSAMGSSCELPASRMARMRSASGVPPGSFVMTAPGMRSASRRSCVDFPEPSIPSNVMNMGFVNSILRVAKRPSGSRLLPKPIPQSPQVMLAHQRLENSIRRQHTKPFAEPRAAAEVREPSLVRERPRFELVDAEEARQFGMLAVEDRAGTADRVLPPRERVDCHRVVVTRDRVRVVANLQAE